MAYSDDEDVVALFGNESDVQPSAISSPLRVATVLSAKCCGLLCTNSLTFAAAQQLVQEYDALVSRKEKRKYLNTAVKHGEQKKPATKPVFLLRFAVQQKPYLLCGKAVALLFRAAPKTVYAAIKRVHSGAIANDVQIPRALQTQSPQHIHMSAWLRTYITRVGQHNPTNNTIIMPVRLTHAQLYNEYRAEVDDLEQKVLSLSSMIRLLHLHWPNLQFPHLTGGIGKCDRCFEFKQEIAKKITDADKAALKAALNTHLTTAREERDSYAARICESKILSNRILSIAFDGASSLQFPHEYPAPRMVTNSSRLETLLYGTLTHTFHRRRLYTSPPAFTHDINYVLTVLAFEIVSSLQSNPHFDPTTLYLQADNCVSQNKNQYLFAFIAVLLFNGWFTDVHFNFLSVGHTHDDVDAIFGLFASQRHRTCTSAPTLPNLIEGVTSRPTAKFSASEFVAIGGLWNWRSYIKSTNLLRLDDFKGARSFHFRRTPDGVRLRYRQTSASSEAWIGANFDADSVLVAERPPSGELAQFQPKPRLLAEMRECAAAVLSHLPRSYTVAQREWFNSFAQDPSPQLTPPPSQCLEIFRVRDHPESQPPPQLSQAPLRRIVSPLDVKLSYILYAQRHILVNDLVAVQPADGSSPFWLATVLEGSGKFNLKIRYYDEVPNVPNLYVLTDSTITIKRAAVLVSGFPFPNCMLPNRSRELIMQALSIRAMEKKQK